MRSLGRLPSLVVALLLLLTACRGAIAVAPSPPATAQPPTPTAVAAPTSAAVWDRLAQRPLRLPTLPAGAACPVTPWQPASQLVPGDFGPSYLAFGPGPIYPLIYHFDPRQRAVPFAALPAFAEARKQDKILWIAAPTYRQPALIRGHQLGGSQSLQLASGEAGPAPALRFPAATGASSADTAQGWRDQPSFAVVPAPGCYAFQVDGLPFSDVIVFHVSG